MLAGQGDHWIKKNFVELYCSTETLPAEKMSQVQKLFGHPMQDILPAHHHAFLL